MPVARTLIITMVAMLAFAANSVLCRLALTKAGLDPVVFTAVRLASGAAMLAALLLWRNRRTAEPKAGNLLEHGNWRAAMALLVYAAAFSLAYISLPAGSGALLLFGAVQATMVVRGLMLGHRLRVGQWLGLAFALAGVAVLVAPGVAAPSPVGAVLMLLAGMAWGFYSLLGLKGGDALAATTGNFLRAAPIALGLALLFGQMRDSSADGLLYAVLSGAAASGLGYALWYRALTGLTPHQAASVQLSVPVITTLGAALTLGESITLRLILASGAVLGGIALVLRRKR